MLPMLRRPDPPEAHPLSAYLVAAVTGLLAIVELGSWVAILFKSPGDEFSGWLPGILVYPVAIPLFVIFILVALPKPIQRKSQQNTSCEATGDDVAS